MNADFQIVALPLENFAHLFSMNDAELAAHGARRITVEASPGSPCRVSLIDAAVGESVILTHYRHHDVDSPYQSVGPIFVREAAQTARLAVNEIPLMLQHRLLSLRAYDAAGTMQRSKVVEGRVLAAAIEEFFNDRAIASLHVHNAGPGCFNCAVRRA